MTPSHTSSPKARSVQAVLDSTLSGLALGKRALACTNNDQAAFDRKCKNTLLNLYVCIKCVKAHWPVQNAHQTCVCVYSVQKAGSIHVRVSVVCWILDSFKPRRVLHIKGSDCELHWCFQSSSPHTATATAQSHSNTYQPWQRGLLTRATEDKIQSQMCSSLLVSESGATGRQSHLQFHF